MRAAPGRGHRPVLDASSASAPVVTSGAVVPLLLSADEAQRCLSIDLAELAALVAAGRLPEVRLRADGPVRYRIDDVLAIANAATAEGLVP